MTDFIFTMTTGRSGTAFLAELLRQNLPDAECHHERWNWAEFGETVPDLSHMTLFNSQGNVPKVREFWQRKLNRLARSTKRYYAETSHRLMKAGLIENLAPLTAAGRVHLVALERDIFATMRSFHARLDFRNKDNMWLWYLDPEYPKNLTSAKNVVQTGKVNGVMLWYIVEIRVRAAYYALLAARQHNMSVHRFDLQDLATPAGACRLCNALGVRRTLEDVIIPPPQNVENPDRAVAKVHPTLEEEIRRLIARARFDAARLAEQKYREGFRF